MNGVGMNTIPGSDVIRRTRFLVVDGDKTALENAEQVLRAAGAPHVYVATAPIVALRTLQDPASRVDCVICAHKRGTITGLQFLQSLRAGRWGGGRIRSVKFILTMIRLDVEAVKVGDASGASGYYVGELERVAFIEEVSRAIASERGISPLPKMQVAHVKMSGVDFIFVPFDAGFAQAASSYQQQVIGDLQSLMQEQLLAGAVTPVWETADHGVGYFASPQYHAMLAALTFEFVRANLNRELSVLRPPRYATLSSVGSAAYAAQLAAELANDDVGSGEFYLKGYEVADESAASQGPAPESGGAGGIAGGSPPPPPGSEQSEFGGPRSGLSRGVHGGPQSPARPNPPDFGGPGVRTSHPAPKR